MEECVNVYQKQRKDLLALARRIGEGARAGVTNGSESEERPAKRRRTQQSDGVHTTSEMPVRATRSQSCMASKASQESRERSVVEDSEDEGSQYVEEDRSSHVEQHLSEPDDGLVACPMCHTRMKEEAVFAHLDQCGGSSIKLRDLTPVRNQSNSVAYSVPSPTKARQRLGALNYSLLTETALRRKLAEIGIPSLGSKPLMQRRHMEWMNLWNASCDSSDPKTKRELLRELDIWERTQGRQIANSQGPSGVMAKDFDPEGWTRSNKEDFADLIRKAREKAHRPQPVDSKEDAAEQATRKPQSLEFNPNPTTPSTHNQVVDLTTTAKPSLEQQQSQGSQISGVTA
jgi:E3 ubiquitin-protein ligase RAD18